MTAVTCYEPDGVTVCRFNGTCHDARRRVQALTAPPWGPFRGMDCWAYGMLLTRPRETPLDVAPLEEEPPF